MRMRAEVRATVRVMGPQDRFETLDVEREGHLTWLTLDRPESLNAMNAALVRELRAFFWGLAEDAETRVVVMRGAGRAFCAGLDLKAHAAEPGAGRASVPDGLRAQRTISEIVMLMRRAPQPIIAAVHGAACGGGFALALEDRNQVLAAGTADFREGVAAFLEKRAATFRDA